MKNKTVEGRTSLYNPLLQKPIALHPVGPGSYPAGYGGYAYIGPPPDFGGTYGKFQDTAGREQVGIKSSKMFSIHDGSPCQLQAELTPEERQALLAQMDAASEKHACEHCRSELAISVGSKMDKVFCPHCGSEMDGAAERVKQCMSKIGEMNAMATVQAKSGESQIDVNRNLKPAAVKPVEGGGGPDVGKEAEKKTKPGAGGQIDIGRDVKPDAAKMDELKDATKGIEQIKPMDELAKDMVKAKAEKRDRIRASIKAYRAKRAAKVKADTDAVSPAPSAPAADSKPAPAAAAKPAAAKPAAPAAPAAAAALATPAEPVAQEVAPVVPAAPAAAAVETKAALQEKANLRRELRIMAALEPKKFAEVRKNAKLSAICAEVAGKIVSKSERIKVRAELAVLAAEDQEAHEELSKHLDFIAPEILMEERIEPPASEHMGKPEEEAEIVVEEPGKGAEAAAPMMDSKPEGGKPEELGPDGKPLEKKVGEAAAPVMEGDAAAMGMKTEYLASLSSLKGDRIEMSLYNDQEVNPFWNVVVDGEPVGRVYLQDQHAEDPQAIRAAFCNDSYAKNFGEAVRSVGLTKLLTITKAKLFSHRIDTAEVTARLRDKAKLEAKAEMDVKIQTLRADFMKAMSLAMVAADKNFYQEEAGHALKEGLFNSLVQAGLTEKGAIWAVEAGFEASPAYFEFLMGKSQEIMDMPIEARQAIEKQIMGSGKLEIKVEAPEEQTLAQKLIKSSVNVMAMGGQVTGEDRAGIRDQIGLNAHRR